MIKVSDSARDRLLQIMKNEEGEKKYVRVGVESGGCSGLSYKLDFDLQMLADDELINDNKIPRDKVESSLIIRCGKFNIETKSFIETLPNGIKYLAVYKRKGTLQNTKKFVVPSDHFFLMGDNRDCSKDSRYLSSVGYVHKDNLVGKAQLIFFSSDKKIGSLFSFWKWHKSIRFNRTFNRIN